MYSVLLLAEHLANSCHDSQMQEQGGTERITLKHFGLFLHWGIDEDTPWGSQGGQSLCHELIFSRQN
jgi:hypothetical protein